MVLFRMLFEFHMDHALRNMKLNESVQSGLTKTDIQWVLVIPEIWNSNSMKRFLCTAFKKAGVDDLIVGSDPEVASLYCEYVAVEKETDDLKIFHSGNKYIVFDCGDYTTFVSVHRVQQEKTLHGVVKSIFRDVGDTGSKKAFTQLMDDIIGNRIFSDFRNNYPADSVDMLREFEMQMSIFCGDEDIKVKLRIPVSLIQTFEKETGKSLRDAMSKTPFSDRIKWVNNKLQIKTHLFACLLDTTMQHSICLLREMLRDPKVVGTTNIIMIGRCSKYPYLQRIIKQEFSSFNVVIPADARLSVLKGAVILGHYSR
ncbi:heat shock 70 kDa protein 12A-like [Mytilus galloprovincialis]|uniref:heat shock 70 kDa protein 12A-like n=1 Tax=Mytilus galloprovincialis TaxID=29158 RepID=UPI003F7C2A4E